MFDSVSRKFFAVLLACLFLGGFFEREVCVEDEGDEEGCSPCRGDAGVVCEGCEGEKGASCCDGVEGGGLFRLLFVVEMGKEDDDSSDEPDICDVAAEDISSGESSASFPCGLEGKEEFWGGGTESDDGDACERGREAQLFGEDQASFDGRFATDDEDEESEEELEGGDEHAEDCGGGRGRESRTDGRKTLRGRGGVMRVCAAHLKTGLSSPKTSF